MKCKWVNADRSFQTFDPDSVLIAAVEAWEKEYEHHLSAALETLSPDHD